MPNGYDKNWVRLCAAIDGFYIRHGRWPTRVRMYPVSLQDLREHVLTRADFAKIEAKLKFIADETGMTAEDDTGANYDYAQDGFPESRPKPDAAEWLGVRPKHREY